MRINEETKAYLESKAGEKGISAYVRDLIQEGKRTKEDNVIQNEYIGEILQMCDFFGISVDDFIRLVLVAMEKGEIGYQDGEIVSCKEEEKEVDTTRFEEACSEKGVDPQKMIDKATQMVWGM